MTTFKRFFVALLVTGVVAAALGFVLRFLFGTSDWSLSAVIWLSMAAAVVIYVAMGHRLVLWVWSEPAPVAEQWTEDSL